MDLGSGARQVLRRLANPLVAPLFGTGASGTETVIGSMGWSPDGSLLAVRDGPDTLVLDRHGELRTRLRGAAMVNGSQSWSPDGRGLLVYDGHGPTFSVRHRRRDRADGPARADATQSGRSAGRDPGSSGSPGRPARSGSSSRTSRPSTPTTWMRFDVGAVPVESVTWSSALTGTVRR